MNTCLFRNGSVLVWISFSKVFRIQNVPLNLCTCYAYVLDTYPYMCATIKNSLRVFSYESDW